MAQNTGTINATNDSEQRWQITFTGSASRAECDALVTRVAAAKPREIHAFGNPLPENFLIALASARLPALERLVLALGVDQPGEDDDMVVALLSGIDAPKLTIVHVDALEDINYVFDQLATYGQTRAWKELRLGGAIDDEQVLVEIVEKSTAALAGLDVLGLPIATYVSAKNAAKLRKLCPAVRDLGELPPLARPTWHMN